MSRGEGVALMEGWPTSWGTCKSWAVSCTDSSPDAGSSNWRDWWGLHAGEDGRGTVAGHTVGLGGKGTWSGAGLVVSGLFIPPSLERIESALTTGLETLVEDRPPHTGFF